MSNTSLTRILLVDDEPDIRKVALLSLEAIGNFTVESCQDGNEALSKVMAFAPDLILMDVMMPGKDGPTTFSELQNIENFSRIPVIFMTARVQETETQEYLDLGAIGVISKPFDPMTLPAQIQDIWSLVTVY